MKEAKNIAFEISPLMTASGSFGDKSGVYRYTYGLISSLSDYIKKSGLGTKIFLFSFNYDMLKHPLNPELYNLIKNENVIYLDKFPNVKIADIQENAIFEIPIIRFAFKVLNRIFSIKKFYGYYLHNKKFKNYISLLNKTLKKNKVGTVIHSETGFYTMKGFKNLITIYDLTTHITPEFHRSETIDLQTRKIKFAKNHCQGIICISKATKNDLIKYFPQFKTKEIMIGYPGIDSTFSQKPNSIELNKPIKVSCLIYNKQVILKQKKYLLYYGTFEPRKNINYVVKAFLDLFDEGKVPANFKLLLIGGKGWGNIRNSIIEYLRENYPSFEELPIIIVNYINDKNLKNIIKNAYGLVYPSFYEGFGLPVLEAMHFGIPVITSRGSSLIEVGGDAVLYVDPRDFIDIKKKMAELINSQPLANVVGVKGIEQSKKFTWKKTAIDLYAFLSNLNNETSN